MHLSHAAQIMPTHFYAVCDVAEYATNPSCGQGFMKLLLRFVLCTHWSVPIRHSINQQIASFRSNVHPRSPTIPEEDFFFIGDVIKVSRTCFTLETLIGVCIVTLS